MAKKLMVGKQLVDSAEFKRDSGEFIVYNDDVETVIKVIAQRQKEIVFLLNGEKKRAYYFMSAEGLHFDLAGKSYLISSVKKSLSKPGGSEDQGHLKSPMPGKILQVLVTKGKKVKPGDSLLVMEAMKMEHTIKSSIHAEVDEIYYEEGSLVDGDVELISLGEIKDKD